MGFKCGIVGLPNVGKSTLFNALTQAGVAAANFPFCTIAPHTGVVPVPDTRLDQLAHIVRPKRTVPTCMTFVDIAGLVKGAAQGEGLGNQFLSHIRATDALIHVVRCFEDSDIVHVCGKVDPTEDVATIHLELVLADLETVERTLQQQKKSKSGNPTHRIDEALLEKMWASLSAGHRLSKIPLNPIERATIDCLNLLTLKPSLYIANIQGSHEQNIYCNALQQFADQEGSSVVAIDTALEAELAGLNMQEKKLFLREMNIPEPGLQRLIRAGYALLNLRTYFTVGVEEGRAWTVPIGSTAVQAAGRIHSDFARGFIRAEVISFQDYITYQGEAGAKEAGKWRLEGKEYLVQEGDIIYFRFNV